ncbi:MAG: hypothetical protein VKK04_12860 [Synechococcales bacterium]|nr:hypothetical protein [Synechococcales bacterium]
MAKIVAVHGISQEYRGRHTIRAEWLPQLKDGLERAGWALESDDDFDCAFYGDIFRKEAKAIGIPDYNKYDIETDWERSLLLALWTEVSKVEPDIAGPNEASTEKGFVTDLAQKALRALSRSRYFGSAAEKFVIHWLKQVGGYLHDPNLRRQIRDRVVESISDDTRVLIGHSLGSIVSYEVLCEHPEWPVEAFVSLGSPLGIRTLIFDRLDPAPKDGVGHWPGSVTHWVNIADKDDVVALEKQLDPLFQETVVDWPIDNGIAAFAHDGGRYLTAKQTGEAIKLGLGL